MLTIAAAIVIAWIIIANFDVVIVLVMYAAIAAFFLAVGLGVILLGVAIFG